MEEKRLIDITDLLGHIQGEVAVHSYLRATSEKQEVRDKHSIYLDAYNEVIEFLIEKGS